MASSLPSRWIFRVLGLGLTGRLLLLVSVLPPPLTNGRVSSIALLLLALSILSMFASLSSYGLSDFPRIAGVWPEKTLGVDMRTALASQSFHDQSAPSRAR